MALGATVYRFEIDVSDVDRGVYEKLDLRVARHPSETLDFMLTRTLAYCLSYEEGISFSKGLSTNDEPALWVKNLQGTTTAWIEVGSPSAERLHKASKANERVAVFTHHDVPALLGQLRGEKIHDAAAIPIYAIEPALLGDLSSLLERHTKFELVRSEGQLYVTLGGRSLSGAITQHAIPTEP